MQKPIDLLINDFRENIYNFINNSGLPLCVSNLIIRDIYKDLEKVTKENLQKATEQYYSDLQKESMMNENDTMNLVNNIINQQPTELTEENSEEIRKFNES